LLGRVLPSPAQSIETINFVGAVNQSFSSNQAIPDGAPISGAITFDNDKMDIVYLDDLLTVYTNESATVSVNVNGRISTIQGIEVLVDVVGGSDLSGQWIPSDRMVIDWPADFYSSNSITIYCPEETFRPPSGRINFTDSTWWSDRLPYPIDYAVRIDGLVAPLSAYGIAPVLNICQTNGCVVVSYPSNVAGYVLESSSQPGTSWQVVTNAPVLNNANLNVMLPCNPNSLFFRLRAN